MNVQYCPGFVRQQQNPYLGIPREIAAEFSDRLLELLGYRLYKGIMGHVDGSSPGEVVFGDRMAETAYRDVEAAARRQGIDEPWPAARCRTCRTGARSGHRRATTRSSRSRRIPTIPRRRRCSTTSSTASATRLGCRGRRSARAGSSTVPGPTVAAVPTSSSRSTGTRRSTCVAGELARVRDQHGNESIYGGSYGWASAGRFHHAQSQLHRFLNCIGGYTRSVNSYSLGASEVILPHVVGGAGEVLRRATTWKAILEHTELVVAFGGMNVEERLR